MRGTAATQAKNEYPGDGNERINRSAEKRERKSHEYLFKKLNLYGKINRKDFSVVSIK